MAKLRNVLVADDDRNDFLLVQLAFQKAGLPVSLTHVLDGQQAVDYLSAANQFAHRSGEPLPDLMLLDLKMPLMDGFDVLSALKKRPSLQSLPVVVLSASQIKEDIARAMDLGARDFLTKPADFPALVEIARSVFHRWLPANAATS
jgi:two-component system response regulator